MCDDEGVLVNFIEALRAIDTILNVPGSSWHSLLGATGASVASGLFSILSTASWSARSALGAKGLTGVVTGERGNLGSRVFRRGVSGELVSRSWYSWGAVVTVSSSAMRGDGGSELLSDIMAPVDGGGESRLLGEWGTVSSSTVWGDITFNWDFKGTGETW